MIVAGLEAPTSSLAEIAKSNGAMNTQQQLASIASRRRVRDGEGVSHILVHPEFPEANPDLSEAEGIDNGAFDK